VSLKTLSVQLQILLYATNSIGKCVHPSTVLNIKNKSFSVLAWHGLSTNMKYVLCSMLDYMCVEFTKLINEMHSFHQTFE